MKLEVSGIITKKLRAKHNVSLEEVEECFYNRTHGFLIDTREEHKTNPQTQWFIADTDKGRTLKVCFMVVDGKIRIKTAFEANNSDLIQMYYRKAQEE